MSETTVGERGPRGERPRVDVAVPRKGRPLEAVLERIARTTGVAEVADSIVSTLRYEKSIAKGNANAEAAVYERLDRYSDLTRADRPEFTLVRDDRSGFPRRIVFDSLTVPVDGLDVRLVGREEPFRALRTHEFALGFDSADLVLEEVVRIDEDPLAGLDDLNARIDPTDTDVRVISGLGDTVYHTLMATPETRHEGPADDLTREFLADYEGPLCISPRYERLVQAVLGTDATDGLSYTHPDVAPEEAAIAETGIGVYLTVTGSTARDHGLELGEELFPSETVLMENVSEAGAEPYERVIQLFTEPAVETELAIRG